MERGVRASAPSLRPLAWAVFLRITYRGSKVSWSDWIHHGFWLALDGEIAKSTTHELEVLAPLMLVATTTTVSSLVPAAIPAGTANSTPMVLD